MSNEQDNRSFRFMPSKKWFANENRPEPFIDGSTIPEAYLKACARLGSKYISDADAILGELDYAKSRVVTLLIADSVKNIKAERIGIFMPSLAATDHLLVGCIMAKKVPVPLNWTLGRKSLEHVLKSAELTTILTSKKVWSRMDNVPKDLFEDKLLFLEDILKAGATPWVFDLACMDRRVQGIRDDLRIGAGVMEHLFLNGHSACLQGTVYTRPLIQRIRHVHHIVLKIIKAPEFNCHTQHPPSRPMSTELCTAGWPCHRQVGCNLYRIPPA